MNMNNICSLKGLDALLRCTICFDYFNICMMTACSHNYCSVCIRKYLTYKSECPICFKKSSEPELRNNRLIDELVQQHMGLRNLLQKIDFVPEHNQMHVFEGTVSCSDGMKSQESSSPLATSLDNFYFQKNDQQSPSHSTNESDYAFCPVCSMPVQIKNMDSHLDTCLKRRSKETSESTEKRKPIPKVAYYLMPIKDLKKRLSEFGLSTEGNWQALIKRHRNFLVLYNAECDSLHPRPVSEIIKQLEKEESVEKENECPPSVFSCYDRRIDPDIMTEDQENYMKLHKNQYEALIDDIRSRQEREKQDNTRTLSCTLTEVDTFDCENGNQENVSAQNVEHSQDIIDLTAQETSTALLTDSGTNAGLTDEESLTTKAQIKPNLDENKTSISGTNYNFPLKER